MSENWSSGKYYSLKLLLMGFMTMLFLQACSPEEKPGKTTDEVYTCPMHPQIIRNEPGTCPICHMELVKKTPQKDLPDSLQLKNTTNPPNQVVLSNVKAIHPKNVNFGDGLELQGYITHDQRQFRNVAVKTGGRIEKLHVRYAYEPVIKGQKLFDLYSPELLAAQEEYILLLSMSEKSDNILKNARQKLSLLGLTSGQIANIEATGKAFRTVTIFSPFSGHIHEGESMTDSEMRKNMTSEFTTASISIQEGNYLEKGGTVFSVNSEEQVWAIFEVFPTEIGNIRLNERIVISKSTGQKIIEGNIDFIEPYYGGEAKAANIRVYLDNRNHTFKIGERVTGKIVSEHKAEISVPETAVVYRGLSSVVFVKKNGAYYARKVEVGPAREGWVQILKGLTENDEIAENAQFLVDSESFIYAD